MCSRQRVSQGLLGAGGAPTSARTSLAPSSHALGWAADPAVEVSLADGVRVLLRQVRAEDATAVRCLFQGLSERSTWLRFFTVCPRLDRVVGWATEIDNHRRLGVVAVAADSGQLIAHAGLERDHRQPDRAEFALVVADPYQGRGLGGILLGRLVDAARHVGIGWLTAEVLANNHRMLNLLRHARYPGQPASQLWGGFGRAADLALPPHRPGPRRLSSVAASMLEASHETLVGGVGSSGKVTG
jgi:RimJ/RimL family protein N-acetyltransferase